MDDTYHTNPNYPHSATLSQRTEKKTARGSIPLSFTAAWKRGQMNVHRAATSSSTFKRTTSDRVAPERRWHARSQPSAVRQPECA